MIEGGRERERLVNHLIISNNDNDSEDHEYDVEGEIDLVLRK